MKYKYLKEWESTEAVNLKIKGLLKYQDQYLITFFKNRINLQISLNQGNSFLFYTDNDLLPWVEEKSLNLFNQILNKATLVAIKLLSQDRIYFLDIEKTDIYNETKKYTLICELGANFENIVLCENSDDKRIIIDSLKRFSFADNNQRQIIPKMEWHQPVTSFTPQNDKVEYFIDIVGGKIVEGLSSGLDNINDLLEKFYYSTIITKKMLTLKNSLISNLQSNLKKVTKKLKRQEAELNIAQDEEKWLHYAELLKSSTHKIKKGMTEIKLVNYYNSDFPEITIPLFDDKSPGENINYYFKKYKKAKVGQELIAEQIKKTKEEIKDIQADIQDIQDEESYLELVELTSNKKNSKRQSDTKTHFRRIKIDDSWEIFIGRSSTENDLLTCKVAKGRDWWFHTRVFQGTHVVLRNYTNKQLPDKYRILCAQLAAYYSRAKKSENVPVDYTQIRFVRKPRGSAPGYVTYKNQKTLYVNPLDYREAMKILGIKHE